MKLKLDEAGHVVVSDGKPVYVTDDGKEVAFDAPGTVATITRLNGEAKGHREAKEAAEGKLKAFEGIEDPAGALDALKKMAALKDKDLVDAGKVEEIKAQAIKAVEEKYAPIVQERDKLSKELHSEKIGGSFARSKFIADKIAVPADLIQSQFGSLFTLEDGKIVAKRPDGNPVYSKANPGNPASFDEALEILIDEYPHKDHILKGTGNSGGGSKNGHGGGAGAKTISRADFDQLDAGARIAKVKEGVTVTDAT